MGSLAVILSLCTVAAVGLVFFFTDSLLLSLLVLAAGLGLTFYLDRRWRLDEAKEIISQGDMKNRDKILKDLKQLKYYKEQIDEQAKGAMAGAVDNIYAVSDLILHEEGMDLKFIHQVGLYIPRINKILDTYLLKSADPAFKNQSQEFMERTSEVFTRLLTATGSNDMKEAESIMQALEETYRMHGHSDREDRGNL